tara:strand:+ start:316 stop:1758 length:1443 start_codon:yes stop_codon:yes gene_type:complete
MAAKGSASNGHTIHLGPRFAVRGTHRVLHIRDLDGFEHRNADRGELLNNAYLVTTPIVRKIDNRYHLINQDHHGLSSQLDQLSNGSTIWVFELEADNDPNVVEKVRFFTQLAVVQIIGLGNDFAHQFIRQIGASGLYQAWLTDHYNLKMFPDRQSTCPVNQTSLAKILGVKSEYRVKKNLAEGWQSRTDGDSPSAMTDQSGFTVHEIQADAQLALTGADPADTKEPDSDSTSPVETATGPDNSPDENYETTSNVETEPQSAIHQSSAIREDEEAVIEFATTEVGTVQSKPMEFVTEPLPVNSETDSSSERDVRPDSLPNDDRTKMLIELNLPDSSSANGLDALFSAKTEDNPTSEPFEQYQIAPDNFSKSAESDSLNNTGLTASDETVSEAQNTDNQPPPTATPDFDAGYHPEASALWKEFAKKHDQPTYEVWYSYLQSMHKPDYAEKFSKRIIQTQGDHVALAALIQKVIKAVGSPADG